jgi:hypothetical protein
MLKVNKYFGRRADKMKRIILIVFMASLFFIFPEKDARAIKLLCDTLDVKGSIQQTLNLRTKRDERDVQYSSFRTMFRLEGLYDVVKSPDLMIQLYGLANYYYDEALDIDNHQKDAVRKEAGRNRFGDFRHPQNDVQWLKELYMSVKRGPFEARIGKQMVSWGETAEARVSDLINPLDLTYILAFPDWEDYKLGLWMGRFFNKPENMWQDISFELVYIPFDFEKTILPVAGSGLYFGAPEFSNYTFQKLLDKQKDDAPGRNLDNFEIGLRIRGYSHLWEGIDWTLSQFYTRLDSPLLNGKKAQNKLLGLALFGINPKGKMYTYPRYNSTAFTSSTTWKRIGADIRAEIAYNTNVNYQYGTTQTAYKIKEKDLITSAITISRKTMVPYISDRLFWNRSRAVDIALTWYEYHLLRYEHDRSTGEYIQWDSGHKHSYWRKFTLQLSQGFFNDTLTTIFGFVYDTQGPTTVQGGFMFMPGDHWQWLVLYQQLNEQGIAKYQDQVIFSMRYDF